MPFSNWLHIPVVVHYMHNLKPRTILDVGVGLGMYGFLARCYLDVWDGKFRRGEWTTQVDGVEVFEPYRNPLWEYAYDRVVVGDVRAVVGGMAGYDLSLLLDVIEHFPIDEARELAERMLDVAPVVIVSTPNFASVQGAWGGNPAEEHKSFVCREDLPHVVAAHRTGVTDVFVCAKNPAAREHVRAAARTAPVVCEPKPSRLRRTLGAARHRMRAAVRRVFLRRDAPPRPDHGGGPQSSQKTC